MKSESLSAERALLKRGRRSGDAERAVTRASSAATKTAKGHEGGREGRRATLSLRWRKETEETDVGEAHEAREVTSDRFGDVSAAEGGSARPSFVLKWSK